MKSFVALFLIVALAALMFESCSAGLIPGFDALEKLVGTAAGIAGNVADVATKVAVSGVEVAKTAAESGIDVAKTAANTGIITAGNLAGAAASAVASKKS